MTSLWLVLSHVAAFSSVVTAIAVVWLCARVSWLGLKIDASTSRFFMDAATRDESETSRAVTVTDALLRIEEAVTEARKEAQKTSAKIDVGNVLGFQNREGQHRMEDADAAVASGLAGSIARADALPQDGNYGAAADAALRSPEHDDLEK